MGYPRLLIVSALLLVPTAVSAAPATASSAGRQADAVVMTGSQLPHLVRARPQTIVGFRHDRGRWRQIPVQVDERALIDFREVRQSPGAKPFSQLAYTDANTYAGADPDAKFDSDDELALMARDAGTEARKSSHPRGVMRSSRTRLTITDPLRAAKPRFVYLYRATRGLDPAAGRRYVRYNFSLDSGDPKSTYDYSGVADDGNGAPANPEHSTVTTPFYSTSLGSRWITDGIGIRAGSATGVDLLDADRLQVNNSCGRSELTFSRGGGGFIANKSGPVRAIRSYIGANSGTYTQRDHIYYDRMEITRIYLRVHSGISRVSQYLDYAQSAVGMRYRNAYNPAGVLVDGEPDALDTRMPAWEQVTGGQGTLTTVSRIASTVPNTSLGLYYLDDFSPSLPQCGNYSDRLAVGASGLTFTSSGANTDPTLGAAAALKSTRVSHYSAPNGSAADAALVARQVDRPLTVRVR